MIKKILNNLKDLTDDSTLSALEIRKDEKKALKTIYHEFRDGLHFIKKYPKSVSIFGSARVAPDHPNAILAEELARKITHKLHYAIITGGGPGIMMAANKGAFQAGGQSVGLCITLPHEQRSNEFIQDSLCFDNFFSRKNMLTFAAEAYVFFPGGFGTMDELFSILTLVQTKKIPNVPIFLVGSEFWKKLDHFIRTEQYEKLGAIDKADCELYTITDNLDYIVEQIGARPIINWWKEMEA